MGKKKKEGFVREPTISRHHTIEVIGFVFVSSSSASRSSVLDQPGLDIVDSLSHTNILGDGDGTVDSLIPHWRTICTIHDGQTNQHFGVQGRFSEILSDYHHLILTPL